MAKPEPPSDVTLCLVTVPDMGCAGRIATELVERRLAACVNIIPGLTSIYRWKDELQRDGELLLLVKTTTAALSELKAAVKELHPYAVPELLAFRAVGGLAGYIDWVRDEVRPVKG